MTVPGPHGVLDRARPGRSPASIRWHLGPMTGSESALIDGRTTTRRFVQELRWTADREGPGPHPKE